MKLTSIVFILLFFIAANYDNYSQPIDNNRTVHIESINVNSKTDTTFKKNQITISDNDTITVNYKLRVEDDSEQAAFLFQTTLISGADSSIKTGGTPSIIFRNLNEGKYQLLISAFDLQRKWTAIPTELTIIVDNEKISLIRENTDLKAQIEELNKDLLEASSGDSTGEDSIFNTLNIVLIILVIALAVVVVLLFLKQKSSVLTSTQSRVSSNDETNTVDKLQYEELQIEFSKQKAEISSLRGQIDAMSARSAQLSNQNRELQVSLTKLSKNKSELEELQEQKDELFAVIIHDIKNPASLIKNLVELLTSYDLSAVEQQEIINDIATTTSKIVALSQEVSRILALETSKMILNIESCNLNDIVQDVYQRNTVNANKKSINMSIEINQSLPNAELDPQRIDEVVDNLVSNAIKYTSSGGTVNLTTSRDGNNIIFEVKDNGLGLTEEDLKSAFQRGARLSAKPTSGESSTGLGLWIVKKLLDAHNGRVWVKSSLGKGSTFSIAIPMYHKSDDDSLEQSQTVENSFS